MNQAKDRLDETLHGLKWASVAFPMVFLGAVNYLGYFLFPALARTWWGFLVLNLVLLVAVAIFSNVMFTIIERTQARLRILHQELQERNTELGQVHTAAQRTVEGLKGVDEATVIITGELSLDTLLQKIVNLSRNLLGAQYGALLVLRGNEQPWFLTSGLTEEQRAAMKEPPRGRGLLGAVLDGGPIRIRDMRRDYRSIGFPPYHPDMKSFLGVPVIFRGHILGSLYLTNKVGSEEFSEEDEHILLVFARHAAIAIENARLYQQARDVATLEERERIAREMHDNFAQVLGYVSTKTMAVRKLLDLGRTQEAETQLSQMEEAARQLFADVREAILGLRSPVGQGVSFLNALEEYTTHFSRMSGIRTRMDSVAAQGMVEPSPGVEIQVFRIVQEALTNVRKHAQASEVRICLEDSGNRILTVLIEDNGRGFDPERLVRDDWPHFGLQTMRERAQAVGGTVAIESRPGSGTRITITIPVNRDGVGD